MPGGGGTSDITTHAGLPAMPKFLMKYFGNTARGLTSAQGQLPDITSLYNNTPLLGTAQLGQNELNDIQGFQNNIGPNAAQNQAAGGFQQFLGQNGKPSEATQAALKEFNDLQAPAIMGQAALSGLGTSGAGLAALAQGQEQALVPFMQGDLQNQLSAAGGLGNLGGQEAQQMQQQLQNALQAAGMPREISQQMMQNLFNQSQQKQDLAKQVQMGGSQQFPSLIGGGTSSQSGSTNSSKF